MAVLPTNFAGGVLRLVITGQRRNRQILSNYGIQIVIQIVNAGSSRIFVWFAIWFLIVLGFSALILLPLLAQPRRGPSFATQRDEQRKIAFKRILDSGGMDKLRQDCEMLMVANHTNDFFWKPPRSNVRVTEFSNGVPFKSYVTNRDDGPLPASIANLEPHSVDFAYDPKLPIVRIELFGMHRTGGWDIPYYELWVVCSSTNRNLLPALVERPKGHINKIADFVFEVYQ